MKFRYIKLLFILFFSSNVLNAAYIDLKQNEKKIIKVLESRIVRDNFWQEIKKQFQSIEYNCQEMEFLYIMEFLFERIKVADKVLVFNQWNDFEQRELHFFCPKSDEIEWEDEVRCIFIKIFGNALSKFDKVFSIFIRMQEGVTITAEEFKFIINLSRCFAYSLLEDVIVSSKIFSDIQKGGLINGKKAFLLPIQEAIYSTPSIHKVLAVCEVLIFIKDLHTYLLEKKKQLDDGEIVLNDGWNIKEIEDSWYQTYVTEGSKKSIIIQIVSSKWPKNFGNKSCSEVIYNLIETFCKSSDYYYLVRYS